MLCLLPVVVVVDVEVLLHAGLLPLTLVGVGVLV